MEHWKQNLGKQKWFRFLADKVFGRRWLLFLLGIGSILFFLPFVTPESSVPVALLALGGLCYLLSLLGQLVLSLDPYEERAKQHASIFWGELLLLYLLLIARQLGFLEPLVRFLF